MFVVEALYADGQAIDACCAEGFEAVFLKRAGVGFQGDFAVGIKFDAGAHRTQQLVYRLGREQAGRTATDEDTVHRAAPDQRQRRVQVCYQCVKVALLGGLAKLATFGLMRIEIAIGAFFNAPGNMDVQGQRGQAGQLQQAGAHVVLDVFHMQQFTATQGSGVRTKFRTSATGLRKNGRPEF